MKNKSCLFSYHILCLFDANNKQELCQTECYNQVLMDGGTVCIKIAANEKYATQNKLIMLFTGGINVETNIIIIQHSLKVIERIKIIFLTSQNTYILNF